MVKHRRSGKAALTLTAALLMALSVSFIPSCGGDDPSPQDPLAPPAVLINVFTNVSQFVLNGLEFEFADGGFLHSALAGNQVTLAYSNYYDLLGLNTILLNIKTEPDIGTVMALQFIGSCKIWALQSTVPGIPMILGSMQSEWCQIAGTMDTGLALSFGNGDVLNTSHSSVNVEDVCNFSLPGCSREDPYPYTCQYYGMDGNPVPLTLGSCTLSR